MTSSFPSHKSHFLPSSISIGSSTGGGATVTTNKQKDDYQNMDVTFEFENYR